MVNTKRVYAFLLGFLSILLGGIPLLIYLGISISIPATIFNEYLIKGFLVIGGFFLLYYAIATSTLSKNAFLTILAGFLMAIIGLLPVLIDLKLLNFLPFIATLDIPIQVLEALLVFFGFYLVYEAIIISRRVVMY